MQRDDAAELVDRAEDVAVDGALGGVNGDVFGAVNELARIVALHAGVVAWTRF